MDIKDTLDTRVHEEEELATSESFGQPEKRVTFVRKLSEEKVFACVCPSLSVCPSLWRKRRLASGLVCAYLNIMAWTKSQTFSKNATWAIQ